MKPFERAEYNWSGSDVQNITHIQDMAQAAGHPITRERARKLYRARQQDEIWINDKYQVAIRRDEGPLKITHLSIKRLDKKPQRDWREFQQIKNELLGKEVEAVELYPAEARKVDAANQFHLWALPEGLLFTLGFTEGLTSDYEGHGITQRKGAVDGKSPE